jgi:CheY-like chemotaxis protein
MINQITSWQRAPPPSQRGHRRLRSTQYATALRSYDRTGETRQTSRLAPLGVDRTPARILVIDDIYATGKLVYHLHRLGYWTTRTACSGETALPLARNFLPSVVLIALELPDMNAYRVATQLREQAGDRELRLIALTNDYAHTGRDLARQAGFERYLAKPVSVAALNELLHSRQP